MSVEDLVRDSEVNNDELKRNFKLELYGQETQRKRGARLSEDQKRELLTLPTMNDVIGYEKEKKNIISRFFEYPQYREDMKSTGLKPPSGMLLCGYPGTGKTLFLNACIKDIFRKCKTVDCRVVDAYELMGSDVGQTSRMVDVYFENNVYNNARNKSIQVLILDDIEILIFNRGKTSSVLTKERTTALLKKFDGLESKDNDLEVYLIGATNRPWDIDPSFIRDGRFSHINYISTPNLEDRLLLLEKYFKHIDLEDRHILLKLSRNIEGLTGNDIKSLASSCFIQSKKRPLSADDIDIELEMFDSLAKRMKKIELFEEEMKKVGYSWNSSKKSKKVE